jgi:hypothetical protein
MDGYPYAICLSSYNPKVFLQKSPLAPKLAGGRHEFRNLALDLAFYMAFYLASYLTFYLTI